MGAVDFPTPIRPSGRHESPADKRWPAIVSTAATTTREDLSEDAGNHGLCDGGPSTHARGFFLMGSDECRGG
jgi:hypothetical protein